MDNRLQKFFSGELSGSERIALLQEICRNEDLRNEYVSARNLRGLISLEKSSGDMDRLNREYDKFESMQRTRRRYQIVRAFMRYAAVIAITLVGCLVVPAFFMGEEGDLHCAVEVPAGQHSIVRLPDGSTVYLNSASTLSYPGRFKNGTRRVELAGEGYFKVAHDSGRPFIVTLGDVEIKVLGTTFNARYYSGEETRISLLEGSVSVSCRNSKPVILRPMQALTLQDGKAIVESFDSDDEFLWRDGIIVFDRETLAAICSRLENYYGIKIDIQSPSLEDITFTGKFRLIDGPSEILRILSRITPFSIGYPDGQNAICLKSI